MCIYTLLHKVLRVIARMDAVFQLKHILIVVARILCSPCNNTHAILCDIAWHRNWKYSCRNINWIIGASLNEPCTSESNGGISLPSTLA